MILGVVGIIGILVLIYLSAAEKYDNCKEKVLIVFYKSALYIYKKISKTKIAKQKSLKADSLKLSLQALNPGKSQEKCKQDYYVEKIAYVLMIIAVSSLLAIGVWIADYGSEKIENGNYLKRQSYGQGTIQKDVVAIIDADGEQNLSIKIEERKYTEQEINHIFDEIEDKLSLGILGENTDIQHITTNMDLPVSSANYPVEIQWRSQKSELINDAGEVFNADLKMPVEAELKATLIYEEYERECCLHLVIFPKEYTYEEKLKRDILSEYEQLNENRETENIVLPDKVQNKTIVWEYKKEHKDLTLIALGILTGLLVYFGKDKEIDSAIKKRDKELLMDYPEIVSKLTLLLGAGMPMRAAWEKIIKEYLRKKKGNSNFKRYAYEEMLVTYYEIQNGLSEIRAYENFGKRCCNQRYLKMSAIITQNLKKGSRGLSNMLQIESNAAYEDRKALAKIAGEEAGTKLMGPMILMLVVVMILIIVPAVSTF